ncbi:MAG: hypothetical protein Q8Q48_00905 [Candidatus Staskawiczbacteria bacterium]|nr:hypothetical protein [Candidatus Staskawiczbacteria bacterium]
MKPIKWKRHEKELLRDQLLDGIVKQARVPGRSYEAIRKQALKMQLIERERHPPLNERQIALVCSLKAQGLYAKQISELDILGTPSRTASAIQKVLSRLGLVNKNKSLATKNRKTWKNGELERFEQFLKRNSKKLPPRQIAERFGVSRTTVDHHQRKLGVKPTWAETMATPFIKKRMRQFFRERSKKKILNFKRHIAEREKKLEALAKKIRGKGALCPEDRQCKRCKKIWLKHRKFFFHAEVKKTGYSFWYFTRICVICEALARYEKRMRLYRKKYSVD